MSKLLQWAKCVSASQGPLRNYGRCLRIILLRVGETGIANSPIPLWLRIHSSSINALLGLYTGLENILAQRRDFIHLLYIALLGLYTGLENILAQRRDLRNHWHEQRLVAGNLQGWLNGHELGKNSMITPVSAYSQIISGT
jgi:hypothetical protein